MSLFSGFKKSKEDLFWKWFEKHSAELLRSNNASEPIYDRLTEELRKVDNRLTFEFSVPKSREVKEFTISVDGIVEAMESAIQLFNARPSLADWNIKLFRQRSGAAFNIQMNGIEIKGEDSRFLLVKDDPGRVGILLFYQNFDESLRQDLRNISYIFLDTILGEYDVMTKVGVLEVFGPASEYFKDSRPFDELAEAFDRVSP